MVPGHPAPVSLSPSDVTAPQPATVADDGAQALLHDLYQRGGLEFAAYHPTGLLRRIQERMKRVGVADFEAYRAYLAADPEEHRRLCEAVPVHWTAFFRDPGAWAHLAAEVLPPILARREADAPVRAWVVGCATGEEAYTLAMLLAEALGARSYTDRVTVFATDVSAWAVAAARSGRYPTRRMEAVSPALREKYFEPCEGGWAVRPGLRRRVLLSRHDVLRDPPFARLDLVACRNTLMFHTSKVQEFALARLYLGLRDGGALFVGRAETPTAWTDLFRSDPSGQGVFRPVPGRRSAAIKRALRGVR